MPVHVARSKPLPPILEALECWPRRTMAGHATSLADVIVRRAVGACRRVDPHARLSSISFDCDSCATVRLRCGDGRSLRALQTALQAEVPFARVSVDESLLDGTMEIVLVVPGAQEERASIRAFVTRKRPAAYSILLAWLFLGVAILEYASSVRKNHILLHVKDEL